jgi:hypothetical protein
MVSGDFRAFQRQFFQSLRDRPLDLCNPEDRALYEPLYTDSDDPVARLHDTIDFSVAESVQLVAGFRGTGKTTEFSRLEARLRENGFLVVRVDLDSYLDLHSPVDVTDFLLVLSGAIGDRLRDPDLLAEGAAGFRFWDEAKALLRGVSLDGLTVSGEVSAGPVNLAAGIKADPTIRAKIRSALQGQLPQLVAQVHAHHVRVIEALRQRHGADARLVVIVDSLEHIRGTTGSAEAVHASVQSLFFAHARHLQLPDTHMVLSVPPVLALQADNLAAQFVNGAVQAWSSCEVVDRRGNLRQESLDRLLRLVSRRGDWHRLIPDETAMRRLLVASGGYIRDLLNMLIEAIHLAREGSPAPDVAERVIANARRSYQPLYADEVKVLARIAQARDLGAIAVEEKPYILRFLDAHLVLCYLDTQGFWYDVHPLVREQVLGAGDA